MSVSPIKDLQQTSALTSPVKDQNQGLTAPPRRIDRLEDKGASSPSGFCYCLSRIYHFFCALFRCLFCIKDKPAKLSTEEKKQTTRTKIEEQSQNTSENLQPQTPPSPISQTPLQTQPEKQLQPEPNPQSQTPQIAQTQSVQGSAGVRELTPEEAEAEEARSFWDVNVGRERDSYITQLEKESTKSAFAKLSLEVRLQFLGIVQVSASGMFEQYREIHQAQRVKESQTQPASMGEPPKPEPLILGEAALRFVTKHKHELGEFEIQGKFGVQPCETREQILAFIKISAKEMYDTYEKMHQWVSKSVPPTQPVESSPTRPLSIPAPQPAKAVETPKSNRLILGTEAQQFLDKYGLDTGPVNLRHQASQQPQAQDAFGNLKVEDRNQLLAFIEINAESMYETYYGIHEIALRLRPESTAQPPDSAPSKLDPIVAAKDFLHHEDVRFFTRYRTQYSGVKGQLLDGLRRARGRFTKLDPKAQDRVLLTLTEAKLYPILKDYLSEKWLGSDRIAAFTSLFNPKYSTDWSVLNTKEAEERQGDLITIFTNGFGSTAKSPTA